MKRNISEDLPERKFAPAAAGGSPQGKSDAGSSSDKEGGSSEKTPEKKQSRQFMIFVTEQEEKIFLFVRHFHSICKIVVSDKPKGLL